MNLNMGTVQDVTNMSFWVVPELDQLEKLGLSDRPEHGKPNGYKRFKGVIYQINVVDIR